MSAVAAPVLRSSGIGGSDIAAILGMDPRKDAFAVYCDKLGLIDRAAPSPRMRWGRRIERVIAEAYADETKQTVEWSDTTMNHPRRPWQIFTPDALVVSTAYPFGIDDGPRLDGRDLQLRADNLRVLGGMDAKNVAWDQAAKWADDTVPDYYALQCHWYMSASGLPWWDVAALFGGNDLRIMRVEKDAEIEATLLEEGERFWKGSIVARVQPPIGSSSAAAEYLRKRFPKNVVALRHATADEVTLLASYAEARADFDLASNRKETLENELKLAIAEADGLTDGRRTLTYKLDSGRKGYTVAPADPSRRLRWTEK